METTATEIFWDYCSNAFWVVGAKETYPPMLLEKPSWTLEAQQTAAEVAVVETRWQLGLDSRWTALPSWPHPVVDSSTCWLPALQHCQ
jgi:hypothetical protein